MRKILLILLLSISYFSSYGMEVNDTIAIIGLTPNSRVKLQLSPLKFLEKTGSIEERFFSKDMIDEIYGDKIRDNNKFAKTLCNQNNRDEKIVKWFFQYGGEGERFSDCMKRWNSHCNDSINHIVNNSNGITISCSYDDLSTDELVLKFVRAKFIDTYTVGPSGQKNIKGWSPDKQNFYIVKIYKITEEKKIESQAPPTSKDSITNDDKNGEKVAKEGGGSVIFLNSALYDFILLVSILTIIVLIIVIFIRINKLNKKVEIFKINKNQSSPNPEAINIDKIKLDVISKIQSKDLVQRISDEDIYNVINRTDIQLYIQNVIVGKVEEYLHNKVNISTPLNIGSIAQPSQIVQPELRTTKVEYRAENNCFIISENSQIKIFEIYSTNGEYYYTIVNDASIKKEMLGFITAFSGCVETRQDSPIPSTVEVLRDGRLIKNGDMYIIDTNCILQVSLK